MIYVFDECVGQLLADFMKKLGEPVEPLTKYVDEGTKDCVWIPKAGRHQWVIVTFDYHIGKRREEVKLYKKHRCRGFAITVKDERGVEKARQLLYHWDIIRKTAETVEPPYLFKIPRRGSGMRNLITDEMLYPPGEKPIKSLKGWDSASEYEVPS